MSLWLNAHIVVATNIHTSYAPKRGEVQQSGNGGYIVLTVAVINTIPNITLAGKNVGKLIRYNKETGGYWKGKNRSEETKEKLRQANLGKKWTPEEREKFIESRTGKTHNTKNKIICDGVVYTSYRSCAKAFNISPSALSRYLKGQRKIPQKFIELGLSYHEE